MAESDRFEQPPYERFEALTRRIVQVPKKEVDRRAQELKDARDRERKVRPKEA